MKTYAQGQVSRIDLATQKPSPPKQKGRTGSSRGATVLKELLHAPQRRSLSTRTNTRRPPTPRLPTRLYRSTLCPIAFAAASWLLPRFPGDLFQFPAYPNSSLVPGSAFFLPANKFGRNQQKLNDHFSAQGKSVSKRSAQGEWMRGLEGAGEVRRFRSANDPHLRTSST